MTLGRLWLSKKCLNLVFMRKVFLQNFRTANKMFEIDFYTKSLSTEFQSSQKLLKLIFILKVFLQNFANNVANGDVALLDARRVGRRHDNRHVRQVFHLAALIAQQGHGGGTE